MRISDWSSDVCSSDLQIGQGGRRYNSSTKAGEQRLRDPCPPTRIDRRPIAVERRIEPAFGAELGIGMPTDVREQASHVAQSCETGRFVGKKRCNPPIEQIAVLDETAKSTPFLTRGDDQRIFGALALVALAVEQPLKKSASGAD